MYLKPQAALNKAYRRQKVNRNEIETFRKNLSYLLHELNEDESEEHLKNDVTYFLNETWYKDEYLINTKGRTDLAIYNEKTAKSSVGVLLEVKKPGNKAEMVSQKNLNTKALQELLLYYLREKYEHNNGDIKHLVVTNIYEWFIFDASQFYDHFFKNKALKKAFEDWNSQSLESSNTDYFYKEIAAKYIAEVADQLTYTWFDLRGFESALKKEADSKNLIALYKVLSPVHLLKKPFANDSNSLNKQFYHELLHIIGLEEAKEKGKKVIQRKAEGKRIEGSFLENAIITMDERDRLNGLDRPSHFGDTQEERLYAVALELCITWINRILFLKLMESQLVTYHKGDQAYRFLDIKTVPNYDALESLFFGVLARRMKDRSDRYKEKYSKVPYLNSSLFEPTRLEEVMTVTMLNNNLEHELYSRTVLKDANGRPLTGKMDALEYLFRFLEAYDFSSEGKEEIQEENKSLINASVLGLIFEKINGYKDGSFYTPGFITMYMCRETIRRAVVQKFNAHKGWKLETFDQLYDKIDDKREANGIINSLKICDPAVGSGHFLVSALNEIIAIKSELKILLDREGKTLRDYEVTIENDELIVESEGELFQYAIGNKEKQRVQETLFHEKQTIIENCLFGVDINANSVKICRLRLWIELLKNAYYKNEEELETLPNIDINIKTGNSLISRFDLDVDISDALKKSRWDVGTYRDAVNNYKNATKKEDKRQFEQLIDSIKGDFETEINKKDKRLIRRSKLQGELFNLTNQQSMFALQGKEKKKWEKDVETKTKALDKLEKEIDEIKNNKIYEDAFEWRFEFPEVLDDQGNFKGFDVVIGNPPYVFARDNFKKEEKEYYYENYAGIDYQVNLYVLFAERTIKILNQKGNYSLIVPNALLMVSSTSKIRKLLFENGSIYEVVNFLGESFEDVSVETVSFFGHKNLKGSSIKVAIGESGKIHHSHDKSLRTVLDSEDLILNVFSDENSDRLLNRLKQETVILDDLVEIKAGLQAYEVGKGMPKQTRKDVEDRIYDFESKIDENTYPYYEGKDVNRYFLKSHSSFLKYGDNLAAPRKLDIFSSPKVIIREITGEHPHSLIAAYSEDLILFNRSNIAINEKENSSVSLKYILALLNSKLMSQYFQLNTAKAVRKMFPKIILKDLRKFPIKKISLVEQKAFIDLVDQILNLKDEDPSADTSRLEQEIDQLVYELYGLTEEEIKIVEGG